MAKMTKRTQQAKETKALIVDTGLRLFSEKGFKNTTVDEICNACGVAKGTFYHYFKTKFDLFASSTGEHVNHLSETYLTDSSSDVCSDIILIITSYIDLVERRGSHVGREIARRMLDRSDAGQPNVHKSQNIAELAAQRIQQSVNDGSLSNKIPVDQIKAVLDVYMKGLLVEWETQVSTFSMMDRCLYTAPTLVKSLLEPYRCSLP